MYIYKSIYIKVIISNSQHAHRVLKFYKSKMSVTWAYMRSSSPRWQDLSYEGDRYTFHPVSSDPPVQELLNSVIVC